MQKVRLKYYIAALLAVIVLLFAAAGICLFNNVTAEADAADYGESYRNRLAYSVKTGWNNDPNGLLYADGVYHMYYQYATDPNNVWANMSWGHATSTDLIHWEQREVAIPANQGDYALMFSGSAVYDENNTSGFFDIGADGKVQKGHGIVAILTQPDAAHDGAQRQILAYSKNGGNSFEIHGEILPAIKKAEGGYEDYRDPKVFWSEKHAKWLMAVGGGSIRMYSSDNLKEWKYLGATGYWGECPDISRHVVDGEEKYLLITSPKAEAESHIYNKTNCFTTYYPAEYYVVGDLDDNGLFTSRERVRRVSEGADSYAFQSFNNSPDGKVYGVSWCANWDTVDGYASYRKNFNGGMTVVCEMSLVKQGRTYSLMRKPVEEYSSLRGEKIADFSGTLAAGKNAFSGARADVAHINAELDFSAGNATYAQISLRVSAAERILINYDVKNQTLTLDRSQSSLLAQYSLLYGIPSSKNVPLIDGKLSLEILLDRAFVSVFANGGSASWFSAVSNGMSLISDGEINVNAQVYKMNGIFGNAESADEFIISTDKVDTTVGATRAVVASSYGDGFDSAKVSYDIADGEDIISLTQSGSTAFIKALKAGDTQNSLGYARVTVNYDGQEKGGFDVWVHNDGFISDIDYKYAWRGYSVRKSEGLLLSLEEQNNAFRFSDTSGEDIIYSARFTPENSNAQAGGLVFGVSDNFTGYWVATADIKDNKVKLWKAGVGDLKSVNYAFTQGEPVDVSVIVTDGTAKIYINGGKLAVVSYKLADYAGGRVGVNVYNAAMLINNVTFKNTRSGENSFDFGNTEISKVVNVTDGSYRLKDTEYTFKNGLLSVSGEYLQTLEEDTEYTFRVITSVTDFNVKVKTDFTAVSLSSMKDGYLKSDNLSLILSEDVAVTKLEIDGEEYGFAKSGKNITVSNEVVSALAGGEHTVKVYTQKGRPVTSFALPEDVFEDYVEEETEPVSRTFLYIDVAIFATFIVGYAAFSAVKKFRAKK